MQKIVVLNVLQVNIKKFHLLLIKENNYEKKDRTLLCYNLGF